MKRPKNPKQPHFLYETFLKLLNIHNTYLHSTDTTLKITNFY